jgi:ketosteroid isomerase-like protein
MSRENVEIVRRSNAAANRGDLDAAFACYAEAAVWHSRSDEPDTGSYRGLDAIRAQAGTWASMLDDLRFELDDYVDAGEHVIASGWMCGRGTESGAEVREPFAWVLRLRDGQVVEVREYRSRDEAIEALPAAG